MLAVILMAAFRAAAFFTAGAATFLATGAGSLFRAAGGALDGAFFAGTAFVAFLAALRAGGSTAGTGSVGSTGAGSALPLDSVPIAGTGMAIIPSCRLMNTVR
jgi:hypothetical protein